MSFKVLSLFSGIGAFEKALKNIGVDYDLVGYSEIDKYASKSYAVVHNVNESMNLGDITKINEKELPKDIDLITYGYPCQDISLAGKQKGLFNEDGSKTRSGLFFDALRIIEEIQPRVAIAENVKNLVGKKFKPQFDIILDSLDKAGYNNYWQVLNAKDYGIPQNRERVFIVSIRKDVDNGFEFPKAVPLQLRLKDMLDDEVDEKYYLSKEQIDRINNSNFMQEKKRLQEKDYVDTLLARDYKDPKCVAVEPKRIGGLFDTETSKHQAGSIWDKECISPTIDTMQGGYRQPLVTIDDNVSNDRGVVVNDKPRKDIKELDKNCKYCGKQLKRKRFNGRLEDFTVFSNRKYCNRECMRKDWVKIGDNHNHSYSNAHTTARKINELILHKEVCELCGSDTNLDIHHIDGNWQNNNLDNLMCLCRSCHTKYERNKNKNELRIRKLTPLEVWRLMGFDDEDFEKAEKVNSNTQLYKQAGNSIVVNVLEHIFSKLNEFGYISKLR